MLRRRARALTLLSGTHPLGLGRAQQYYQLSMCKPYREATQLFWLSFVFPPTTPNFLHMRLHYSSYLHLEPGVIARLASLKPPPSHGADGGESSKYSPQNSRGGIHQGGIRPHPLGGIIPPPPVVVQASRAPAKHR